MLAELVIATHNNGKAREISALLAPYVKDFTTAGALNLPEPEETGATFIENAELKALAAAIASGKPALADDSGLAVTALGGDPGIYSARWGGPNKDFNLAMQKVQDALTQRESASKTGAADRSAAFVCALSLAYPDGRVQSVEGRCAGTLIWPARGAHGFGYDPIFVPDGFDRTFAEMEAGEKQAISHRAKAFDLLVKTVFNTDKAL